MKLLGRHRGQHPVDVGGESASYPCETVLVHAYGAEKPLEDFCESEAHEADEAELQVLTHLL